MSARPTTVRVMARRQIAARHARWARTLAVRLVRAGASPNLVSVLGVVFSALAGACLVLASRATARAAAALFVSSALLIALRAVCNLMDGMIAVEGDRASVTGGIWNDVPDRLSDLVMLACAGASTPSVPWGVTMGWLAATGALLVAYTRVLGGALCGPQSFAGPMAKQHRIAVVIAGALASAAQVAARMRPTAMALALLVVVAGAVVTLARRVAMLARALRGAASMGEGA